MMWFWWLACATEPADHSFVVGNQDPVPEVSDTAEDGIDTAVQDTDFDYETAYGWSDVRLLLQLNSCVECHLDWAKTYDGVVGATSSQVDMMRVEPGFPNESYLFHKVSGTHESVGGSGVQMPSERTLLGEDDLSMLEDWILGGAPN